MPAEITLPPFLKEKLDQAPHRHVVHKALENFSDWFRSSRLPFFPDYTDHGIQHIEQVLATAANLIPDQARAYFSGADAVALILAVLLHDSALHLTEAGVWQLLKEPAAPYKPIASFDQKGWAQTWDDFMFLARRWDDTKLTQVFGSTEPGGLPTAAVRDPFAHWHNLGRTDHLLIGEFIRQQHPRLAHEMALHGVPGTSGALLKLDDSLPAEWRDLVGLIARSHGLPLRTCLDYLKTSPDFGESAQYEYDGIHAVYLMALLRVADYVQIQGDRTSNRIFNYKKIYSAVSTIEHKVHQAVRSITNKVADPEALFIQARPGEVSVFLRLKEWLAGIQQELDGSWAVLGEVYGRDEELRNLGLAFRRVRSNLDDVAKFAKTVPYVPDRIRFDVARAELLKLLIGPLYGDDPSYGVRELMQNAIDAVREYDQFVQEHHAFASVPRRNQEADVHIELSKFDDEAGYATMSIVDKGIGMQEEIIRDYFLKAGASYRRSPQWKTTFEADSTEGAKSKVVRSGRFGVGALAAFLIGSEIEVETKHISASSGFRFKATIDREYIELQRVDATAVGTSISIKVDKKNYSALIKTNNKISRPAFFNWYIFDKPTVARAIDGVYPYYSNAIGLQYLPSGNKPTEWRRLVGNYPYQVYWAYTKSPMLVCNGFFISNSESLKKGAVKIHKNEYFKHPFDLPNISIIDPDGLFPLSIKRDGVREGEYPFESDLVYDVLSELIAWVFFQGPSTPELPVLTTVDINDSRDYFGEVGFVMKASGYAVRLCTLLDRHPIDSFIVQPYSGIKTKIDFPSNKELLVFTDFFNAKDEGRLLMSIRSKNGKKQNASHVRQVLYEYGYHVGGSEPFEEFSDERPSNKKKIYVIAEHGPFIEATTRKCPNSNASIKNWPKNLDYDYIDEGDNTLAFEERFFSNNCYIKVDSKPWVLDDLWKKYFDDNWLPYNIEKRLSAFPDSAKELAEKYPQVVPDIVWNYLNIDKPLTTIVLPSYDSLFGEADESPF